ncbi:hypothetical protein QZH41_001434 [Actinostola sp. cb2023]|nr:hypothetical protein QZH41_001434 [Actinostola sp. cb2023]
MLVVKVKVTKANGTDFGDGEKTAPVNNLLQSLFKQVDVFLNGVQVTQSTGTYSYRSYYETILNFGPAAKKSQLTAGLFYKDTAGNLDSTDPTLTNADANLGLKSRYSFIKESALVDLFGPIYCDLFYMSLTVDGEQIPFKPINLKLTAAGGKNFIEAYQTLFSGSGMIYQNVGNDISREDYSNGYGLLVFDLTPDHCSSSTHLNQKQKGNISLEIQFTTGLVNAINLIIYGEFESIIQVDQGRHVIYDYTG